MAATPLHPHAPQPEEPLDSPEVLVLNALLGTGRFDPKAYGLDVEMLTVHQQAWRWCEDYQDQVGEAPSRELFHRAFPNIEVLGGSIDPNWAAVQLKQAHYEREVRRKLRDASNALRDKDMDAVRDAVRELVQPSPLTKPKGMSVTDVETVAEAGVKIGFNTPWPSMTAGTHGVGRGELWLTGARLGQGKSWLLPGHTVAAAEMGARVAVASCEMPIRQYVARIHAWQAKRDQALLAKLRSNDIKQRREALHALPPLKGSIDVFDPSVMRMNIRAIESLAGEYDYVAIDHVGLLQDASGKRAIEDWRIAAVISNSLKEIALRYHAALHGAVQINREGESASANPPKVSNISQTDALGQDADGVTTLKRIGVRSMLHFVGKNREGHEFRFYTKFEPGRGDFTEISADEARTRAAVDADKSAND